jgi:hypothetical protein
MRYIATNELNHFNFHDAALEKMDFLHRNMTWELSALNATTQNSQNNFDKDMCIENAEIVFEQVQIVKIVFSVYKVY